MPLPYRIARHCRLAGASPWHRADPRARLLATLVLSGVILAASSWRTSLPGAAALAALYASSRTGPAAAGAALRPFRILLLFAAGIPLLCTPGRPLLAAGMPFTAEGAAASGLVLLRLGMVILASSHLVITTSPLELARCFGWAISPGRALSIPAREIQLVMALGFEFFPVLFEESRLTRAALESRGISLRHPRARLRLRALLNWLSALLFGMVDRSSQLASALEAKGFGRSDCLRHRFPPWNTTSTALIGASVALLVLHLID